MRQSCALIPLLVILVLLNACTKMGDLKYYPDQGNRVATPLVQEAIKKGADACRYNLEDLVIHAIGDREWSGITTYPEDDVDKRPMFGLYVTTYQNGDQSHVQLVIGKDASGFCSAFWTETRFWPFPCNRVINSHERYLNAERTQSGNSIFLTHRSGKDIGLNVLLTPLTKRKCLVTESEIALRNDPDSTAKEWIKGDHGYDPDSIP